MATTFLTAEWRNLIFANYELDPAVLRRHLPYKTELDTHNGVCYGSLVGFLFTNVRVRGIAFPFHRTFEEFNLRFYVRYKDQTGWKRGVVFVKEIVPKFAITLVANVFYGEKYATLPMRHHYEEDGETRTVSYSWNVAGDWNHITANADRATTPIAAGSEEEFITEHYWGYSRRSAQRTTEYEVVHPRWNLYPINHFAVQCNVAQLYGSEFVPFFEQEPKSVFMADGSAVVVKSGGKVG